MTKNNSEVSEVRLSAAGIELAGVLWHPSRQQKFICLHGWLDNAASMTPLAHSLSDFQLLAIDAAGHGRSDFRSADANYDLAMDVADVKAVANDIHWKKFGLIGHSRGAMVAALFAAAFPDLVTHLVLIDGGAPIAIDPSERPSRLARAVSEQAKLAVKRGSLFPNRSEAIKARSRGFVPVDEKSAELLAERSLIAEDGGFRWRADQRLKAATTSPLESQTIRAFFAAIQCPVLQIVGEDGLVVQREGMVSENTGYGGPIDSIQNIERAILPGDHHLHIGQVNAVSSVIKTWLANNPTGQP